MTSREKTGCILVAEDDEADIDLLTWVFKKSRLPSDIHFVRNGEEALPSRSTE
ncbi:MAG: hypothetical protein ABI041_16290 [Bdellovibrionia bacterium]